MQCNGWSTTARFLRTINRNSSQILNRHYNAQQPSLHAFYSPKLLDSSHPLLSSVSRMFSVAFAIRKTTRSRVVIETPLPPPLEPISLSTFPPAKVSRVASQSIRLCAKENQFVDAVFLLNSVRFSVNPFIPLNKPQDVRVQTAKSDSILSQQSLARNTLAQYKFIDFGQAVPVRLAAHCLLHGLVRADMSRKAARQAELMMADGIRLRTKTLEAILAANVSSAGKLKRLPKALFGPQAMRLTNQTVVSDSSIRVAMNLLEQAKKRRQERTERMYDIIIKACLLQGEILVASLLFIILVKDWQLQKAAKARREAAAAAANTAQHERSPSSLPSPQAIYPSRQLLIPILDHIDKSILEQANEATDSRSFSLSLQALANLANLLDEKQFYTSHLCRLIKVLYSVPKSNVEVWSGHPEKPKKVNAYQYFHDVLERLISRIISRDKDNPNRYRHRNRVPGHFDFDLRTYNSLLHYSLRHRISPRMANGLLTRMTERINFKPDITTYNILLRSGTLLRRSDVSERVLTALRRTTPSGVETGSDALAFGQESSSYWQAPWERLDFKSDIKFDRVLQQLRSGEIVVPSSLGIQTDKYTLTSFIAHLTSTGRPQIVAELLWHLLPELSIVDYPTDCTPEQDRNIAKKMSREACIKRAVTYGPYVFTVILNALTKAGKTGLAERVWILAKEAESASWIEGFVEGVAPWCLPVHAYTCMIQCYADQGRKGLQLREVYGQLRNNRKWEPKSDNQVRGWAKFIYLGAKVAETHTSRRAAAKIMGLLLHRSMQSGAMAILDAMKALRDAKEVRAFGGRAISIPAPDERYFNAVLSLFGKQMRMHRRATRSKKSHWRWLLKKSKRRYKRTGAKSIYWHPMVQEIAQEMIERGYSVPWGYRFMFVGRYNPGTWEVEKKQKLRTKPWAYPGLQVGRFRPHGVPTVKSRGLPFGSRCVSRKRLQTRLPEVDSDI